MKTLTIFFIARNHACEIDVRTCGEDDSAYEIGEDLFHAMFGSCKDMFYSYAEWKT